MENLLMYFAKVNGLIILFYLMYVVFLRKETFFTSNRWYFLTGLLLSLILPLITFTKTIWVEPSPLPEVYEESIPLTYSQVEIPVQETIDWSLILMSTYFVISILIIMKIGMELVSFFRRIQSQNKQKESEYTLVDSNSAENPFSFFSYIVINKDMFTEEELQHILTHESIHVKQKHSFDVLLGKVFCAIFWVNPIIWFYRKAMLQNLEFIADNETFQQIENKYQYQQTLLKVVTHQHNLSITNQFYQSLIKKRIVMLHKNQSQKRNAWKYATILPLLVGFMLLFQIETIAQVKESKIEETNYAVSSNYSSILTKNSTDNELRDLELTFSDEKYKLKISKVKRNKKGEIIEIKLLFDSGKTYVQILERKSTEPINDIKIFVSTDKDDKKNVGFEEVSNVVSAKYVEDEETVEVVSNSDSYTIDNMVKNGKKINLIVNGQLQSATVKSKIPYDQDINVMKELNASDLKSKYNIDKKEDEIYYELTTKKENKKPNSEAAYAVEVATEYSDDETFSHIDKIKSNKLVDAKKALILFNGKEINYQDLDKIDEKTISSSGNTVASHAIKKYGEKGKHGVIFINTKAHDIENNSVMIEYSNLKNNSEKQKPRTIELKSGDVVVILEGDRIKFPGYPTQYLNQLKLEFKGKILEDNIDFFKNYEFEKIKDLIIIEDEMSPKEKKRIKKIIIETK